MYDNLQKSEQTSLFPYLNQQIAITIQLIILLIQRIVTHHLGDLFRRQHSNKI